MADKDTEHTGNSDNTAVSGFKAKKWLYILGFCLFISLVLTGLAGFHILGLAFFSLLPLFCVLDIALLALLFVVNKFYSTNQDKELIESTMCLDEEHSLSEIVTNEYATVTAHDMSEVLEEEPLVVIYNKGDKSDEEIEEPVLVVPPVDDLSKTFKALQQERHKHHESKQQELESTFDREKDIEESTLSSTLETDDHIDKADAIDDIFVEEKTENDNDYNDSKEEEKQSEPSEYLKILRVLLVIFDQKATSIRQVTKAISQDPAVGSAVLSALQKTRCFVENYNRTGNDKAWPELQQALLAWLDLAISAQSEPLKEDSFGDALEQQRKTLATFKDKRCFRIIITDMLGFLLTQNTGKVIDEKQTYVIKLQQEHLGLEMKFSEDDTQKDAFSRAVWEVIWRTGKRKDTRTFFEKIVGKSKPEQNKPNSFKGLQRLEQLNWEEFWKIKQYLEILIPPHGIQFFCQTQQGRDELTQAVFEVYDLACSDNLRSRKEILEERFKKQQEQNTAELKQPQVRNRYLTSQHLNHGRNATQPHAFTNDKQRKWDRVFVKIEKALGKNVRDIELRAALRTEILNQNPQAENLPEQQLYALASSISARVQKWQNVFTQLERSTGRRFNNDDRDCIRLQVTHQTNGNDASEDVLLMYAVATAAMPNSLGSRSL